MARALASNCREKMTGSNGNREQRRMRFTLAAAAGGTLAMIAGCSGQSATDHSSANGTATQAATPPARTAARPAPRIQPDAATRARADAGQQDRRTRVTPAAQPKQPSRDTDGRPGANAELVELPDTDRDLEERSWRKKFEERRRDARINLRAARRDNARNANKSGAGLTAADSRRTTLFRQALANRERRFLAPFHQRLRDHARGAGPEKLVVLQLGDSHSANDNFSGYLRARFQERFGDGGRGMVAAGVPYRFFQPFLVKATQTKGWTVRSARNKDDPGPFGLTGYITEGESDEDVITLATRGRRTFDWIEIEYLTTRRGGSFTVQVNKQIVRTISTRGQRGKRRAIIRAPRGSWFVAIRPKGDGKVRLLSWSTWKRGRGAVWMNQGISGETIEILERLDPEIVKWQMARLNPALIVVAFGTNEGFDHKLKMDEYRETFEQRLQALRAWAPNSTIVLVGAPDAARLPSWCARSRNWRRRRALREKAECTTLSRRHADRYESLIEDRSRAICYWHSPPTLAKIRRVQFRAAQRMGMFYWAWSRVMGGHCGMDRWARREEPFAYRDRVHMTARGYDLSAQAFYEALMRSYRAR